MKNKKEIVRQFRNFVEARDRVNVAERRERCEACETGREGCRCEVKR